MRTAEFCWLLVFLSPVFYGAEQLEDLTVSNEVLLTDVFSPDRDAEAHDRPCWSILDGNGFRIWHTDRELAGRVLAQAEESKATITRAWFPNELDEVWKPTCDVYLCSNNRQYEFEGRRAPNSAGQAHVVKDGSRVLRRKIVLNVGDPNLLDAILPHEVAHIVTASSVSCGRIPVWADEGIAMLNEPLRQQLTYQNEIRDYLSRVGTVNFSDLLTLDPFLQCPLARENYTISFGLSCYLTERNGPNAFLRFLNELPESNPLSALNKIYGISSFEELDTEINQFFSQSKLCEGAGPYQ